MTKKRKNPSTQWYRVTDAARMLGVPRTTLISRIARGDFKTNKRGGVLFVALPEPPRAAVIRPTAAVA